MCICSFPLIYRFGTWHLLCVFNQKSILFSSKGWWGQGPKNIDLSSYVKHLTMYWSENCNLSLKLTKKKLFFKTNCGQWLWANSNWPKPTIPIFNCINFLHKNWTQITFFKFKMINKILISPYLARFAAMV